MSHLVLTVSGTISAEASQLAAKGERPRLDYEEIAEALGAALVDHVAARRATGFGGRLVEKLAGPNAVLAWACFVRRHEISAVVTDGEQVGIPFALLLKFLGRGSRSLRHVMIGHALSARKKSVLFRWLGLASHVDVFLVYASAQKQLVEGSFKVPPERVVLTPFQVDTRFYSPEAAAEHPSDESQGSGPPPLICAVGLERRDYRTLLQAIRGLPVRLVITASSAWSKQMSTAESESIPSNVTVRKFSYPGLRQLYSDSAFMVMPLLEVDFAAGVTAILEAMAMERAVICSRAAGQTDLVIEGETGLYVPVGDVERLRAAILRLLDDPEEARSMGRRARALVQERMSLEHYVEGIKRIVGSGIPSHGGRQS